MIDRPVVSGRWRVLLLAAALLVTVAMALTVASVEGGGGQGGSKPASPSATGPTSPAALARLHAIQQVLGAQSRAIVHHDRKAFMATIDPRHTRFRRAEARMFDNISAVHFSTWSFAMATDPRQVPPDAASYDDPVWAPSYFSLRFRLAGFDSQPTNLRQYPTFVSRRGHWYLGSLTDYASRGLHSATNLWDYGRVTVLRRPRVLVLGIAASPETMLTVADDVQTAIPQVTSVWGKHWPRRAVVLLPRTMHEMALIDDDHEDLSQIAALTSAEVSTTAGRPSPVGDRITVNPHTWPRLSALGMQVVLRHELTHVATESVTGAQTPTWLSEGFADYVGFGFGVPTSVAAAELRQAIKAGHLPAQLPTDRGFRGSATALAIHYEAAWFACRTIAQRFGQSALVRFYRAVGTSAKSSPVALTHALSSVLHLKLKRFIAEWRHQMRAELA